MIFQDVMEGGLIHSYHCLGEVYCLLQKVLATYIPHNPEDSNLTFTSVRTQDLTFLNFKCVSMLSSCYGGEMRKCYEG
jgi:hypothetical protein